MDKNKKVNQIELINSISAILIHKAIETNSTKMTITQEDVEYLGKKLGNWKITIEKLLTKENKNNG